jgi:MoxR-like ATPase
MTTEPQPSTGQVGGVDPTAEALEQALFEVKRVIVGQDRLVERLLTALLANGHCLLEGVPGIAKTLAAQTLAVAVGGNFSRVQFTPDLVPSDIVGTRIYRASTESFDVELGPIMANLVLADEINRAPRTARSSPRPPSRSGYAANG